MKAFCILLLVSACIASSCSKSVTNNRNGIEGAWILKQISGGFAGGTTAPDKKTTITFQSPGKYSTTYNNQPGDAGTYIVANAGEPNYYYSKILLKLVSDKSNDTLTYGMNLSNDSLFLDEGCCDRFSYTYTRYNK